jgi:tetratricopeptide (TPR) repeat protein
MAKKRKKQISRKQPKGWLIPKKQVEEWLRLVTHQLLQQDYAGAERTCQRILRYVPHQAPERGEALEHLATTYTMRKRFEAAYQTLSQALAVTPHSAHIWYNRGLNGRFTLRLVQATLDLEKAVKLETDPILRAKYSDTLTETQEMAEQERALRGPDFTLDQLMEQQELFRQGLTRMQEAKWTEAEAAFRRVIDLGDCHPQPHGNLGLALLMQHQYDAAEAAFERALEIEPGYDLALHNLAALPAIRQSGKLPKFKVRDPMADAKVNLTVQMVDD